MNPPLQVVGLSKRYGARTILRDVNLTVAPGELVRLRGPNGAGKSTLLGCISGGVIPDGGTIRLAGHDLRQEPLLARAALRYLAQESDVPPGLTGREWLQFHADVFADPRPVEQGLDGQILDVLDHLATTYSVGLRRRLAFAALGFGDGVLWVLDVPFAGIDLEGRQWMLHALRRSLERGAGVLLAAHDHELGELADLGPRVMTVGPGPSPSVEAQDRLDPQPGEPGPAP